MTNSRLVQRGVRHNCITAQISMLFSRRAWMAKCGERPLSLIIYSVVELDRYSEQLISHSNTYSLSHRYVRVYACFVTLYSSFIYLCGSRFECCDEQARSHSPTNTRYHAVPLFSDVSHNRNYPTPPPRLCDMPFSLKSLYRGECFLV